MAARSLPSALRAMRAAASSSQPTTPFISRSLRQSQQRNFRSSGSLRQEAAVTAPRRPVGAFRGTLFGFLLGSVMAGAGLYYYVIDEYKVSNELLTEDIYALQAAVQRLEGYVKAIEEDVKSSKK